MFPQASFLGLDLYYWMFVVGVLAAMVIFRVFYKKAGLSFKVFAFSLIVAVISVVLGYLFAVLFQSFYSFLETGKFVWGVGATFYGGLIGAAVCYLAIYFAVGHFLFKDGAHIAQFNKMLSLIFPCIVLAHAFGRLGCLFDGCCYGALTDSRIGIEMWVDGQWQRRIPIQLFESLFLFALFAGLLVLTVKLRFEYTASVYLVVYGVWRFLIEFARDDDRGVSGIGALSPSQFIAVIMILLGVALAVLYKFFLKKYFEGAGGHEEN